ncbi:fungal-specific transcription factor domain-containing protein [Paecilomyces variotii]|uniref:Fungal-specific transcription factor domain-containing protein n=1 Tax=Byssochlamys spectabilis TaxID=264951 RepID=A0A443HKA0_BYSSP|nr:fungal-specific transcription factor domain-containing protein [Paecilomyces variotii]KAJ9248806.1 transcriptional regulator family: Fungal Specific TF [Paecilomyces variotii]KAJ9260248.1 transcriptional regulator family: Fungal Specific TF [Paecilomyces variotii]KAJ9286689.1 transcriptional regulator family: Fungal Specific TF [Paecilomyces variotii]KAJ9304584.1 transcriptional regulator family: Fungal Specific TF [Paecilomyces variotii]KAJ9359813.1 transcriptional regulator family: Fungal
MQNADTNADHTAPRLNRRSCLSCYERKIKCDRREPCSNCSKSNERCDYPRSRIRRNRPRRQDPSDSALADRTTNGRRRPGRDDRADIIFVKVAPVVIKENGYLVADHSGKSRFLASDAWANVKTEESNFTDVLLGDGDRASTVSGPSHMYLFPLAGNSIPGTQSWTPEDRAYRRPWVPTPIELETCWHIFLENVDPVVRILHKPTIRNLLDEAQQKGLEGLPKPSIALLLAICFCAMVTLDPWRSRALFNADGNEAMQHCKHAVEHAMAEAQLIQTRDIQVLQAFTLFLTCVQRKNSQPVWTLIGLAIRIATSLGLHQESVNFGLSPFEIEMRRRLWWQLHLLDMRASEDCSYGGVTSIFYESNTRLPLNINDSDLDSSATAPPTEREGLTEMSFSLLRYDVCSATMRMRKLHYPDATSDDAVEGLSSSASSFRKKEALIEELSSYVHQRYLQYFASNPQSPLCALAAETGKLVLTKTRLVAHHKLLQQLAGPGSRDSSPGHMDATIQVPDFFPDSFLEDLFISSVSLLESQVRLSSDSQFAQWRWLLGFYNQWHATSFILSQLCIRLEALRNTTTACSPSVLEKLGRAWRAVEATFAMYQKQDDAYDPDGSSRSARWGPLEFLRQKVEQKLTIAGFDGVWSPNRESLNSYSLSTMPPMECTGDDLAYNTCSADVFNTLGLFTLDL